MIIKSAPNGILVIHPDTGERTIYTKITDLSESSVILSNGTKRLYLTRRNVSNNIAPNFIQFFKGWEDTLTAQASGGGSSLPTNTFVETITMALSSNPSVPVSIQVYRNNNTGKQTYYLTSDTTQSTPLVIGNYVPFSPDAEASVNTIVHKAIIDRTAPTTTGNTIVTRAQLLAHAVAVIGVAPPAGTAWDIIKVNVVGFDIGSTVTDYSTQVETPTQLYEEIDVTNGGIVTNINPNGVPIQFGYDYKDLDKDEKADYFISLDFQAVITDGSAARFEVFISPK